MDHSAKLSVRIRFHQDARIGPGKIALLEAVRRTGSVQAAGAGMDMSPRRAWLLIDSLNKAFDHPVVNVTGEPDAGPAELTDLGSQLVSAYRAVEAQTDKAVNEQFAALTPHLRTD